MNDVLVCCIENSLFLRNEQSVSVYCQKMQQNIFWYAIVGDEHLKSIDEELCQKINQFIIGGRLQTDDDIDMITEFMIPTLRMKFQKMKYNTI